MFVTVSSTSLWLPKSGSPLFTNFIPLYLSFSFCHWHPISPPTYLCLLMLIVSPDPQALCLSIPSSPCLREAVNLGRQGAEGDGLRPVGGPGSCYYYWGLLLREGSHMSRIKRGCLHFSLPDSNTSTYSRAPLRTGSRQQAF